MDVVRTSIPRPTGARFCLTSSITLTTGALRDTSANVVNLAVVVGRTIPRMAKIPPVVVLDGCLLASTTLFAIAFANICELGFVILVPAFHPFHPSRPIDD